MLLARRWYPQLECCAGPFERARHRFYGCVKDLRHLLGVIAEHIPQNQDRTLARRQELQRGDEGQGDGFSCLVARVRLWSAVGEPCKERVGIGFKPQDLSQSSRLG